jgi:hypothetical protein
VANKFVPPKQPAKNQPQDLDMWQSYYNAIMSLAASQTEIWLDASNWGEDNNDLADMGSGKVAIYAGRYKVTGNLKRGGEHSWRIPLPSGFNRDKVSGKRDTTDPIILVTAENRQAKDGDPVALVVQDVDGDSFRVTVKEHSGDSTQKELNIDTINWMAIGIV